MWKIYNTFLQKNYKWIIPTVISLIMTVITIQQACYYSSKSLAYDVIDAKLLAKNTDKSSKIKILYDNKEASDNIIITNVKFTNNGKLPIDKTDFDKPLSIDFTDNAKILDVIISDKNPSYLDVKYSFTVNKVTVQPLLLNSGDHITFNIISDGLKGKAHVTARIKGVSQLERKTSIMYKNYLTMVWLVINYLVCTVCMAFMIKLNFTESNASNNVVLTNNQALLITIVTGIGSSVYFTRIISLIMPAINTWLRPIIGLTLFALIYILYFYINENTFADEQT